MPPTFPVYLIHVPKTAGSAIKQTLKTLATTSEAFEGWKVTNRDGVVIQHAKRSEMHALRVPPTGEAETVVGVKPAVVGMASRVGRVKDGLHGVLGLGDAGHGQNTEGQEKGAAVEVHVEVC